MSIFYNAGREQEGIETLRITLFSMLLVSFQTHTQMFRIKHEKWDFREGNKIHDNYYTYNWDRK